MRQHPSGSQTEDHNSLRGMIAGLLRHGYFRTRRLGAFRDTRHFLTHFQTLYPHSDRFVILRFGLNAIPVRIDFRTDHRLARSRSRSLCHRQG